MRTAGSQTKDVLLVEDDPSEALLVQEALTESGGSAVDCRFEELYAAARQARNQAQQTVLRAQVVLGEAKIAYQLYKQAWGRTEQLQQLWLSGQQDRLRYSALARMQARLASMPVIEQAKGIIMAQCGWTADEAFDALRRASQRSNVPVRELATRIVATTASAAAQARESADRGLPWLATRPTKRRSPDNREPLVG